MQENGQPSGKIVIAGGTGFLGLNLAKHLISLGCEVVLISRNLPTEKGSWKHAQWDGRTLADWKDHLNGASALVNLTGRTVDCIKSAVHCDEILRSRVEATLVLGKAVRNIDSPPPVWVQMSTAHRYGDSELVCDEDSAYGYGLAPTVGEAWENAYNEAVLPEMRQVILRTSFVLGRDGGALPRLAKITRFGFGGTVANGKQGISWLHEEDMNRLFTRAISNQEMKGVYLATAPDPQSNANFMKELRRAMKVPIGLPAAEFMVRIGAPLFMNTDPELALYGRYCISRRLKEEGYEFAFPDLTSALKDIYQTRKN